jgi:hypothetical protein
MKCQVGPCGTEIPEAVCVARAPPSRLHVLINLIQNINWANFTSRRTCLCMNPESSLLVSVLSFYSSCAQVCAPSRWEEGHSDTCAGRY